MRDIVKERNKWGILCVIWLIATLIAFFYPYFLRVLFPFPYRAIIQENCARYDLDPLLVVSIIKVESGFNPWAHSPKGARGLMQIMPQTGAWIASQLGQNFTQKDLNEPACNIRYGCWYVRFLLEEFSYKLPPVICAYNSGHKNVRIWMQEKTWNGELDQADKIPFPETRDFLKKVMATYGWYQKIYGKNYL